MEKMDFYSCDFRSVYATAGAWGIFCNIELSLISIENNIEYTYWNAKWGNVWEAVSRCEPSRFVVNAFYFAPPHNMKYHIKCITVKSIFDEIWNLKFNIYFRDTHHCILQCNSVMKMYIDFWLKCMVSFYCIIAVFFFDNWVVLFHQKR